MFNFETAKGSFLPVANDESTPHPEEAKSRAQVQRETELLDAYSQAVIGVVGRVGPAVISVAPHPADQQPGEIIAWAGDLAVAFRRRVEKGTLIYLGSPVGPALWTRDPDARRWLYAVAHAA